MVVCSFLNRHCSRNNADRWKEKQPSIESFQGRHKIVRWDWWHAGWSSGMCCMLNGCNHLRLDTLSTTLNLVICRSSAEKNDQYGRGCKNKGKNKPPLLCATHRLCRSSAVSLDVPSDWRLFSKETTEETNKHQEKNINFYKLRISKRSWNFFFFNR